MTNVTDISITLLLTLTKLLKYLTLM